MTFEEFGAAAYRYQRLAATVDRGWVWRLGAVRPWVTWNLGLQVLRYFVWDGGFDWTAIGGGTHHELEWAWLYGYENAENAGGPEQGIGAHCPSRYVVHKFLGTAKDVGLPGPLSAVCDLEARRW